MQQAKNAGAPLTLNTGLVAGPESYGTAPAAKTNIYQTWALICHPPIPTSTQSTITLEKRRPDTVFYLSLSRPSRRWKEKKKKKKKKKNGKTIRKESESVENSAICYLPGVQVCFTFGDLFRKSGGNLFQNKQAPFLFVGKSEGLYVITGHDIALRRRHPPLPALRPHIIGIDSSLSLTAHPRAQLQFLDTKHPLGSCLSVWLRHIVILSKASHPIKFSNGIIKADKFQEVRSRSRGILGRVDREDGLNVKSSDHPPCAVDDRNPACQELDKNHFRVGIELHPGILHENYTSKT
ncbi:hypothetical protein CEXT_491631 [Caerostris extrusa]|uniref:Uncharacterized protein n=1 Tax=Caerostris extrusa TaxID=172846 RepID=A0AAV4U2W3_CAEEX|nr:hypothetical protein CEXT_491631 [Caerostris extrusa]